MATDTIAALKVTISQAERPVAMQKEHSSRFTQSMNSGPSSFVVQTTFQSSSEESSGVLVNTNSPARSPNIPRFPHLVPAGTE